MSPTTITGTYIFM